VRDQIFRGRDRDFRCFFGAGEDAKSSWSHIKIGDREGVGLDEVAARLD
jgi:hypothetical protein